jgi:carboxyl-terminal processing protease
MPVHRKERKMVGERSLLRCLAAAACLFLVPCTFSSVANAQLGSTERRLHVESFDLVWKTVKETHYDSTLGGLDWQGIYDKLRPRMDSASTRDEARSIIDEMLVPLGQSHFLIIPGEYYRDEETDTLLAGYGECGFDIRLIDGKIIVTSVMKESPAFAAGVRAGWEVVRINAVPVTETMRRIERLYKGKSRFEFELVHAISSSLTGVVGESGPVQFRDGRDRTRKLTIALTNKRGHYMPAVGSIPPSIIDFEAMKLGGTVGYIRFNAFAQPAYLMQMFNAAIDSFRTCDGLIIDLRGNSGGMGAIAVGMTGWFVTEKGKSLATLVSRDRTDRISAIPRATTYAGPLAVLIDGCAVSAAEFMAGGLKDIGRARLFGTRTAGFSGRGDLTKLPNGDIFLHAVSQHLRADGVDVEGNGIEPDVEMRLTRKSLLEGRDVVLEAALGWLRDQASPIRGLRN